MERTLIKDAFGLGEKKVSIKGFVHEIRAQSKIIFLIMRDVSGIIQCVVKPEQGKVFSGLGKIPRESVLIVDGVVKESKQAPGGAELLIEGFEVLSEATSPLPIPVVDKGAEVSLPNKLDWRWIDLRKPKNLLIFKLWTEIERGMRDYWEKNGFIQVYSPKFMPAPSETGAELFEVEYFGKKAYLAQSPQFYKQMAMASGFEKIFEIGPVFRANPSHTVRHDTEFTMIDMEISYITSHEDVMKTEEQWIAHFLKRLKETYNKEIKEVFGVEVEVPKIPFPRMTMKEAQ